MTISVHGLAVSRGIAIGRAVLVASGRVDVAHYFIAPEKVDPEAWINLVMHVVDKAILN